MIKYGLISETDARTLEKTIDLICLHENDFKINVSEIGLYNCSTSLGLIDYIKSKNFIVDYTGIDNLKDKTTDYIMQNSSIYNQLIIGNSNEVYNQIEDNSQHLIFIDGCHCFAHVVSDFFCYAPKVKAGGYLAFHDTGKHIKPFKDFQHGDKDNTDAYISVRKALSAIGLLDTYGWDKIDYMINEVIQDKAAIRQPNWKLIFDEADGTNEAGGVTIFKKLY